MSQHVPLLIFPDPPEDNPGDVSLAILLCRRWAWFAPISRTGHDAFTFVIPAAGSVGWWVAVLEDRPGGTIGTSEPVPAVAVAYALGCLGVSVDGTDWRRDNRFGEEENNPYLVNDPRTFVSSVH